MDKKNKRILIISSIIALIVFAISITYAYFQSQIDNGDKKDVDVLTDTTDQLTFDIDNSINLSINKFNFGPGAGDLVSSAKGTAKLKANSTNNSASYNYYVYFKIDKNEFIYTTEDQKTEILLQITDPAGNKVTSVEGLTYNEELQGFDITTAKGTFEIAKTYEITSTSSTTDTIQEWNFTAKFINLDSDQEQNTGKSMNGIVVMQRIPKYNTLADSCATSDNLAGCIKKYANEGVKDLVTGEPSTNIYHHNGTVANTWGEVDTNDGSYRYGGGAFISIADQYKNEYDEIYPTGNKKSILNNNNGKYTLDYDSEKVVYSNQTEAINQAIKDGHIELSKVDNYVCLEENDTCSEENLYRIIGVFGNQVKLVKYKALDGLTWDDDSDGDGNYTDIWAESSLQKYLNSDYLNTLGNYKNIISVNEWNTGGLCYDIWDGSIKGTYDVEQGDLKLKNGDICNGETIDNVTFKGKIGLPYVNEFFYSGSPEDWGYGWLYELFYNQYDTHPTMWTISRVAGYGGYAYTSDWYEDHVSAEYSVRPSFYLNSDVTYKSGDGSYESPIRIEV